MLTSGKCAYFPGLNPNKKDRMADKYKSNKNDAAVRAVRYSGTIESRRECASFGGEKVKQTVSKHSLLSLQNNPTDTPLRLPPGHYLVKYESGVIVIIKAKEFEDEFKRIK